MSSQESSTSLEREQNSSTTMNAKKRPADDTAFPYKQLGVLAICRIAEPIAFISIATYSFVMVQQIKGKENASFYSGLLISAFALAETLTAFWWGELSDRYGRKPIILIALAGTALSSLLFGFATNYWVALFARVVGGGLNGNIAVMQTMVAEIVKRPEHEPKAYAMQPFMWSLGSIVGSAMGGFAAEPAKSYPYVFSKDGLFGKFPFLLPNLIAIAVIVIAFIQAWYFLEETNTTTTTQRKQASQLDREDGPNETTPLMREEAHVSAMPPKARRVSAASFIATSAPIPNEPNFDLRQPQFTSTELPKPPSLNKQAAEDEAIQAVDLEEESLATEPPPKAFNKEVILWTIALTLMCYHQMAGGVLIPIYLLDNPHPPPQHFHFRGGLGLTLPQVGTFLSINSIAALFIQGVIYPTYVAKLGVWRAVVSLTLFAPLVHLAMPLVTLLPKPEAGVYIGVILQNLCSQMIYPSLLILLKNATPSSRVLGKVNGLAMSLCSGARTVSPPVVGIVYSALGSAAAWWSCALFSSMAAVEFCFISRPKDGDDAILKKASVEVEGA